MPQGSSPTGTEPPDPADECFGRLRDDPLASTRFIELVLARKDEILGLRAIRPCEREPATQTLEDLLLDMIRPGTAYDPNQLGVFPFLRMALGKRIRNHRRDDGRRRRRDTKIFEHRVREFPVAVVDDVVNDLAEWELEEAHLERVRQILDPRDVAFLLAVRAGASRNVLAEILGADAADADAATRRAVDRIRVRLKRAGFLP